MEDNCPIFPHASDTWQTAERISVAGSQTVVNINNLHPAKAYHFRMAAENKLGSSEFSEIVQITTLEEGMVRFNWMRFSFLFVNFIWQSN